MEKAGRALLHVGVQLGSIFSLSPASDELRLQLLDAASVGNSAKIKACAKAMRALPSAEMSVDCVDNGGRTPLMLACEGGHTQAIEELLKLGATSDLKTNFGTTALMKLVSRLDGDKLLGTAELLLKQHNTNPNASNADGNNALICACAQGQTLCAQLLLAYGADVNSSNMNGGTSLMNACYNGHERMARMLINHGALVNQRSKQGHAALFYASSNGHKSIEKMLLSQGANKGATRASQGSTRMDIGVNLGILRDHTVKEGKEMTPMTELRGGIDTELELAL